MAIAREQIDYEPERVAVRFMRRGIPSRGYWAVSLPGHRSAARHDGRGERRDRARSSRSTASGRERRLEAAERGLPDPGRGDAAVGAQRRTRSASPTPVALRDAAARVGEERDGAGEAVARERACARRRSRRRRRSRAPSCRAAPALPARVPSARSVRSPSPTKASTSGRATGGAKRPARPVVPRSAKGGAAAPTARGSGGSVASWRASANAATAATTPTPIQISVEDGRRMVASPGRALVRRPR